LLAAAFGFLIVWGSATSHELFVAGAFLGLATTIAIWIWPFLGCLLLVVALFVTIPVVGQTLGGTDFFNIRLSPLLALITLPGLLMRRGLRVGSLPPMRLTVPFTALMLCYLLSMINSVYPEDSGRQFVKILGSQVTLFFVVVVSVSRLEQMEKVVKALAWVSIISAWAGFGQVIAYHQFGINWFIIPHNPKPTAFLTEYGWYGIYPSVLLALFLPLTVSRSLRHLRSLLIAAMLHCATAVALSVNRGAILSCSVPLAAVVMPGFLLGMQFKNRAGLIAVIAVVLLAGTVAGAHLYPNLLEGMTERATLEDGSSRVRLDALQLGWAEFLQHPIAGNGLGTWGRRLHARVFTEILAEEGVVRGGGSANIFLNALYEGGLPAFGAVVWLLATVFVLLRRAIKQTKDGKRRALLLGCQLGFLSVVVNSQLNPLYLTDFAWAIVALGIAAVNILPGGLPFSGGGRDIPAKRFPVLWASHIRLGAGPRVLGGD
jgi:O-antigen ligase